jgi:hypothetical protein
MSKRNRRFLALTLLVVAATLPIYFFQYRFGAYRCEADYCEIDFSDGLLWPTSYTTVRIPVGERVTIASKVDGKPFSYQPQRQGVMGIFTRSNLPASVGFTGGLLAPILLIAGAAFLVRK